MFVGIMGQRLSKADLLYNISDEVIKSKIVACNTLEFETKDYIAIKYWRTVVIKYYPAEKRVVLNSDGYYTNTTKARINQYLRKFGFSYGIYSHKGKWVIGNSEFYDGIEIIGTTIINPIEKNLERERLQKLIRKYCAAIRKLDILPFPENGDCLICAIKLNNPDNSLGDDKDHLISYLKETYIHGSLIINALKNSGKTDVWIRLVYRDFNSGTYKKKAITEVNRAVKRYFSEKLELPL